MNDNLVLFGNPRSDRILLQMVEERSLAGLEQEAAFVRDLSGGDDFLLAAVKITSWNDDLSPWKAPTVFGNADFGGHAEKTLQYLEQTILPQVLQGRDPEDVYLCLGGYSLAALFALWVSGKTDLFRGIGAASPSVWFPGFIDYMQKNPCKAESVYLSLGDKEEKTKNPLMKQVGSAIKTTHELLQQQGVHTTLEWNPGNHFREPDLRTAKAFSWLLVNKERETKI